MGLSLLPLVFSLILTVVYHPYSTNDKTSRLMEKRFSTMRDTQKGSLCYMEKRRGRREIEMTRRRRGGIKKGERNLASNQFLMCSPQRGTPRVLQSYMEKRRGRKEIKVTRRRRGGVKRRETDLAASNQFPKCSPQPWTPKETDRIK